MIPVRVLFFASLREAVGRDELTLEVPEPAQLDDLLASLEDLLSAEAMAALRAENVRLAKRWRRCARRTFAWRSTRKC